MVVVPFPPPAYGGAAHRTGLRRRAVGLDTGQPLPWPKAPREELEEDSGEEGESMPDAAKGGAPGDGAKRSSRG